MPPGSPPEDLTYNAVCDQPVERVAMVQSWDDLTFLHYSFSPDVVQRLLPDGLTAETREDRAWVSLVPFFLRVGLPRVASIPWVSRFAETNVRTYARAKDGSSGIWFFSLDAARLGAVVVARATYRLPYYWSRMRVDRQGATIRYESRRRWPGPRGASSVVEVEVGPRLEVADLTELDHFLTARWALYSAPVTGLRAARAFHEPWPLHRAKVLRCDDGLIRAAGLPVPDNSPIVHWSPSVDVRIGWPYKIRLK